MIFDWKNFYSKKNALIIEKLLNGRAIPLDKLVAIFYSNDKREEIFEYFRNIFLSWRKADDKCNNSLGEMERINSDLGLLQAKLKAAYQGKKIKQEIIAGLHRKINDLNSKKDILFQVLPDVGKLKYIGINVPDIEKSDVSIFPGVALTLLINDKFLPESIRRLPRLSNSILGFEPIADYYVELDKLSAEEIVNSSLNYEDTIPGSFSYTELQKKNDIFKKESDIFECLSKCRLGAYIMVSDKNVVIGPKNFLNGGDLSSYRQGNCGNPRYLKRYRQLERLSLEQIERIRVEGGVDLNSFHMLNELEPTDIEKKFHIKRTLRSLNGKYRIEKIDLLFLENEINDLPNYDISSALTPDEMSKRKKEIKKETPQSRMERISKMADQLQKENPKLSRKYVITKIYHDEAPLYNSLNKNQPSLSSYDTWDRQYRRERKYRNN